jgi:hypothetical protein
MGIDRMRKGTDMRELDELREKADAFIEALAYVDHGTAHPHIVEAVTAAVMATFDNYIEGVYVAARRQAADGEYEAAVRRLRFATELDNLTLRSRDYEEVIAELTRADETLRSLQREANKAEDAFDAARQAIADYHQTLADMWEY